MNPPTLVTYKKATFEQNTRSSESGTGLEKLDPLKDFNLMYW